MKNQKSMGNKGFSLVELIVVIAIMAVLVGVLAPQFIKYVEQSRVSTDVQNAQEILSTLQVAITDSTYNVDGAVVTFGTGGLSVTEASGVTSNGAAQALADAGITVGTTTAVKSTTYNAGITFTVGTTSVTGNNTDLATAIGL
jgi:type IV pilus assembly protein PilA